MDMDMSANNDDGGRNVELDSGIWADRIYCRPSPDKSCRPMPPPPAVCNAPRPPPVAVGHRHSSRRDIITHMRSYEFTLTSHRLTAAQVSDQSCCEQGIEMESELG